VLETVPREATIWLRHSFGGRLVAGLAARHPEHVERLILLDPALHVLPHVAFDLAELERADVSYATAEGAVQARYDSGHVLLAPPELLLESEHDHLEAGPDGRLRQRHCKSAVIAARSIMATPPHGPGVTAERRRRGTVRPFNASHWFSTCDRATL
jgi:pimeloyl-ACP methyl ester carboxylesterase